MYKRGLSGFPEEVVEKMLEYQVEQGNKRDVTVFENKVTSGVKYGGFSWLDSPEGDVFWYSVIGHRDFDLFFDKYPKIKDEDEMLFDIANEHLTDEQVERLYSNRFDKN